MIFFCHIAKNGPYKNWGLKLICSPFYVREIYVSAGVTIQD